MWTTYSTNWSSGVSSSWTAPDAANLPLRTGRTLNQVEAAIENFYEAETIAGRSV